jgi:hypothetical protein
MFVFSFKTVLFNGLRDAYKNDTAALAEEIVTSTALLDRLGLFTMEVYQKTRETVILRQQQEMLELSTPVVELWTGILALPLIGTLDSARTQIVMQNLLEAVVAKGADLAIIDITGVPTVDPSFPARTREGNRTRASPFPEARRVALRNSRSLKPAGTGFDLRPNSTQASLDKAYPPRVPQFV